MFASLCLLWELDDSLNTNSHPCSHLVICHGCLQSLGKAIHLYSDLKAILICQRVRGILPHFFTWAKIPQSRRLGKILLTTDKAIQTIYVLGSIYKHIVESYHLVNGYWHSLWISEIATLRERWFVHCSHLNQKMIEVGCCFWLLLLLWDWYCYLESQCSCSLFTFWPGMQRSLAGGCDLEHACRN